ncbi:class I SAM-dependent methyltransferase [Streptomyces fructofermentans]|uniref:SAM-dependent methyltransferase n=1 Tax=Streptomyces fructofermentans TaxID=152141 RepID=A0A918U5J8_9ACTN|nr:class I SAM-dependent methyltransferase [Streptomyces fructofermentans]GGX96169.1 SAM-dependent methyltransferase [Streptomyces fructofermentans]
MAHDHDHQHGREGGRRDHGHEHGHTHGHIDFAGMLPVLEQEAELYSPMYARVAAWLREWRPDPGMIVDAGSGPGVISGVLAETFPGSRIVAVDGAKPLLDRARERAERLGFADRFSTLEAELGSGLGDLEYPADLLWASGSLHHVGDQRAALKGFADRLAPGGALALMEGGLPSRHLPRDIGIGRPGLQARMDAVQEESFARMRAGLPGAAEETEDWPALLTAAGLRHGATRTFLLDLPAPLSGQGRAFVATGLAHRRDGLGDSLDPEDLATLDRLLDPRDEAGVHRRPDVFVLAARTLYVGVKPR